VVSANAYIGAYEIAQALKEGADVVVTGRVSDPSLTLGPAIAHFGWAMDDWHKMGCGTMAGHMLECGTQVSGGYYSNASYVGMRCALVVWGVRESLI
jgi:hypothetical protein